MKTADEIRSGFLRYFSERRHRVVRSSSLVPENDPTLLFANAGMNQFKDVFLGNEKRDYSRATSAQKCVRAGGKHNDLENVGQTARHHTFFEMLGNFSFGDYFKKEAIAFGWELLVNGLGLPKDRLKVTIFKGEAHIPPDEEARSLWRSYMPPDRIVELGLKENFWAMGDTGPCGPCSEIHFFQGDDLPCAEVAAGRACLGVECECDRWLEIWNLVFMQYSRDAAGTLTELPAPCIDTGMGLERIAAVVQGQRSTYDTDLFRPLLEAVAKRCGRPYGRGGDEDASIRVVADHLRAMTFLIGDGVMPGNEGRGYVLRKILRRAMRHGRKLGIEKPFLFELLDAVVAKMSAAYPELLVQAESIRPIVHREEERFGTTLRHAIGIFEDIAERLPQGGTIPGSEAFRLYDTYGLPLDFTEELARERGLVVDLEGFEQELLAQQERARQSSRMGAPSGEPVHMQLLQEHKTEFCGYETLVLEGATVLAVLQNSALVRRLEKGQEGEIVLDRTPFYGLSGGQVGDHGTMDSDGSAAEVLDCTIPLPGLYLHKVRVTAGGFERAMRVRAQVDGHFRAGSMRNHTATHLLHAALRESLGPHVKQAGSLVEPERLRFDFSHYAALGPRESRYIENRVNSEILKASRLETKVMSRDEAMAYGALAFFGDKYGERVRVVEVPGFSKEFCGGTHVRETGEIGLFLLTGEQGVAAGTRRVSALTGEAALLRAQEDQSVLEELEETAKIDRRSLVDHYSQIREELKAKDREIAELRMKLAARSSEADLEEVDGVRIWTPRFEGLNKKDHARTVDEWRNKNRKHAFVLLSASVEAEGVNVIAAVSESLKDRLKAKEILERVGLRGGGRPEFAQGGGVSPGEVEALRQKAASVLRQMLEENGVA